MPHLPVLADNTLYLLRQGGWVMGAIFLVGQAGWFFVFERLWHFRKQACPVSGLLKDPGSDPALIEKKLLADPRLRGVFAEVAAGISQTRHEGRKAMANKARETLRAATDRLSRHLGSIAVLASSAPLLGLTGTVSGIMATFKVITTYGVGNPAMLAGGIAQALMVTEAGLVVAFPLLLLHDTLQKRADAIESECVAGATTLIRLYSAEAGAA